MRLVRVDKNREVEVPDTYAEGFDMLVKTMNAYHDRRGGNLERLSCGGPRRIRVVRQTLHGPRPNHRARLSDAEDLREQRRWG
jgi:hypothetical protein